MVPFHRSPRLRSVAGRFGFMPITVVTAVLVVALVGGLAGRLADPAAYSASLEQYAESIVARDLEARGWRRVVELAARAPGPPGAEAPSPPGGTPADESARAFGALARAAAGLERTHRIALLLPDRGFHLELFHGPVTGVVPSPAAAARAATVVERELARYPEGALARARLRRVLLCAELAEGGQTIPSLPNFEQTLLLDVASSPAFLRRLVHHELFHFIDFADDDQVLVDPAWEALNDRYFVYGVGGRARREPGSSRLTRDLPGFVSQYATSGLEEDKAEVFSFLLTAPASMAERVAADPIVRRKVEAVERQVQRQLPALDAGFFRAVERGER